MNNFSKDYVYFVLVTGGEKRKKTKNKILLLNPENSPLPLQQLISTRRIKINQI